MIGAPWAKIGRHLPLNRWHWPGHRMSTQKVNFPMNWIYLAIAIAAEVAATSALKASDGFTRLLPSIIVVAGYASAFYFLSLTLRTMPVGVAYAVWSGVGIVLIALIGAVFFKQRLDAGALLGMGLIVLGVLVIQVFSKASAH